MISREVEISCVIPAHESISMLARCLVSIVTQEAIAAEVIVVDDSRGDHVRTFVESLARTFPQILYFQGARTGNPVDNWNAGLDRVTAPLRMLVHHDEYLLDPTFLRRAVDHLVAEDAEVLLAGHCIAGKATRSRYGVALALARGLRLGPWSLYGMNWIGPTAAVIYGGKPDLRFDPGLQWLVDVDFYFRLLADGAKAIRDPRTSVVSYRHEAQISARVERFGTIERETAWIAKTYPLRLKSWQFLLLKGYSRLRRTLSRWHP